MAAKRSGEVDAEAVAAYLSAAPSQGQEGYALIRSAVHARLGAERVSERLSYQVPTFFVDGKVLLHVGLWEEHLAIYPVPDSASDASLEADVAAHRKGKGTLHFPYAEPWPAELIDRVIAAHVERLAP